MALSFQTPVSGSSFDIPLAKFHIPTNLDRQVFIYIAGLQLLLTAPKKAAAVGLVSITSALLVRQNVFGLQHFKVTYGSHIHSPGNAHRCACSVFVPALFHSLLFFCLEFGL